MTLVLLSCRTRSCTDGAVEPCGCDGHYHSLQFPCGCVWLESGTVSCLRQLHSLVKETTYMVIVVQLCYDAICSSGVFSNLDIESCITSLAC